MSDIVIVAAARTAVGKFGGTLAKTPASELGATVIKALLERSGVAGEQINEVILGQVLTAGMGQNPARQAVIKSGLPQAVPAMTINKVCGSGLKAVMLAAQAIRAGDAEVIVAGGMESMTNAPYLLLKGRGGMRIGHDRVYDHMMLDGLEDAYEPGRAMGTFGEECAAHYQFSRADQDAFATASVQRAKAATESGAFATEITPVTVKGRSGEVTVSIDEGPGKVKLDKIATLKPAFKKDGTITAASSSSINDGAAALVMMRASTADRLGARPLARIVSHAMHAQAPNWFTTAPVGASPKALAKAGWSVGDVDLWEVNEAFAVVPMALMADLKVSHEIVNVHGGACALGHPIGASGARILVTLIHALQKRGLRKGLATLCIGGGEATAVALELM